MKEQNVLEKIIETYDDMEFLKAVGLDDAVIGLDEVNYRLIYSIEKCIEIMASNVPDELTEDGEENISIKEKKYNIASEDFFFNTMGAYVAGTYSKSCDESLKTRVGHSAKF